MKKIMTFMTVVLATFILTACDVARDNRNDPQSGGYVRYNQIMPVNITSPLNGDAGVSVYPEICITFDEAADPDCGWTVTFVNEGTTVDCTTGSWNDENTILTIIPDTVFDRGTQVTLTAKGFRADYDGHEFPDPANVIFSISDDLPEIKIIPANGANRISVKPDIIILFNEAADPDSGWTVTALNDGSTVEFKTGTWDSSHTQLTIIPDDTFARDTDVTLSALGFESAYDNYSFSVPSEITFTITGAPVMEISPSGDDNNRKSPATPIVITFSEPVKQDSGWAVKITEHGLPQTTYNRETETEAWTWSESGRVLTITPSRKFSRDNYVDISTSGFQALDNESVNGTSTRFYVYNTNPTVTIYPANDAQNVDVNTALRVVFSEPMNIFSGTASLRSEGLEIEDIQKKWYCNNTELYIISKDKLPQLKPISIQVQSFTAALDGSIISQDNTSSFNTGYSDNALLTDFQLPGTQGYIIGTDVIVKLPPGTNPRSLAPVFGVKDGTTLEVSGQEQTSGVSEQNFLKRVTYVANDSGNTEYSVYADIPYGWTKSIGGTNQDSGNSITTDKAGNIYITGSFRGTVDFDPGLTQDKHSSNNNTHDIFITKLNADGSYAWTKTIGGTGDDSGNSVTADSSGNIYITGYFKGSVDFDPGVTDDVHSRNSTYRDIFLARINADGTYAWTYTMENTSSDGAGNSVTTDNAGNVYITGMCDLNIFVSKINRYGICEWSCSMGETNNSNGNSVTTDSAGNIFITGYFRGQNIDFDPGTGADSHTSNGGCDIFMTKISANGSYAWTRTIGGNNTDEAYSVTAGSEGNIYVAGSFMDTVDFNPGAAVDSHTSKGDHDIFLTRINADGSYAWTRTIGGHSTDKAHSVTADSKGGIYITGKFFGEDIDFDPGTGANETDLHSSTKDTNDFYTYDIFITKINSDGTYVWTRTVGGSAADNAFSITADSKDNVYLTGSFSLTADFNPYAPVENHTAPGPDTDIFIMKLEP